MGTPRYATQEPIRKEDKKPTDKVPQPKKKIKNPKKTSQQPTTKKKLRPKTKLNLKRTIRKKENEDRQTQNCLNPGFKILEKERHLLKILPRNFFPPSHPEC